MQTSALPRCYQRARGISPCRGGVERERHHLWVLVSGEGKEAAVMESMIKRGCNYTLSVDGWPCLTVQHTLCERQPTKTKPARILVRSLHLQTRVHCVEYIPPGAISAVS